MPQPSGDGQQATAERTKAAKEAPDLEEAIEEEDEGDVAEPAEAADDDELVRTAK